MHNFMEGIIRTGICFFCHDGQGKYLLQKRSKGARDEHDRWDGGGGGLRFGEKIEDAVVRELQEEYKTTPINIEFLGYRDVHRVQDGKPTHWIAFDFKVEVDATTVAIGEPHKCDELRWLTVEEIETFPEQLHSHFPAFWEKNKKHFI